jgi:predicted RNA-binding protein with TRAM domain
VGCGTLKPLEAIVIRTIVQRGRCQISPSKRSPRNAKNKRGRGVESCPVELGQEYEVDITEMSPDGEGIARIRGFLIFVDDAKSGDHVKVRITTTGAMSADAVIIR